MERRMTPLRRTVAVVLVVAVLATAGSALAATQPERNATGPGTAVASAIDTQRATLDGSLAAADLRERLVEAETPAARARVAATALDDAETRLGRLESRTADLRAARERGTLDADAYAARMAPVVTRARAVDARARRIRTATASLNATLRREANVSGDRIDTLQSRAADVIAANPGGTDGLGAGFYRRLATAVTTYNESAGSYDLGVLGAHVNGERVTLRIDRTDGGTGVVSFRTTEDGRVRDLRAGSHPDATLALTVDEPTARGVLTADQPDRALRRAFASGEITIRGVGPLASIKWTITTLALGAARLVVDLFTWFL